MNHLHSENECESMIQPKIKSGKQKWIFHRTFTVYINLNSKFGAMCLCLCPCIPRLRDTRRKKNEEKTAATAIWKNKQSTDDTWYRSSRCINSKYTIDQLWLYWTDLKHSMHESICNQIKRCTQMQTNVQALEDEQRPKSEREKKARPNQL